MRSVSAAPQRNVVRNAPTRAQARGTPQKVKLSFRLDIKYIYQQPENRFLFLDIHTITPTDIIHTN
ncbi:MAG: hypothetical protein NZ455_07680 [Bacteroidia bacterium]|nr:hypothetical protein [Bacteroidia bacterium]MDW8346678.1 hypothetical protein [Bacteroidia bacterium]